MFPRIHLIVLDSVGFGEAPDAASFNDSGSDTFGHIADSVSLHLPNLEMLGIGNIPRSTPLKGIQKSTQKHSCATKLQEISRGKDTLTGHWEMMGLITQTPFHVFPYGFPEELLQKIETFSGRKIIRETNRPYSGTQVITDFGERQIKTGELIVYTSADPVLQIAAHEEIIPPEELYKICQYTRKITREEPYRIGRIIARPYIGIPGNFKRTANRHDYSLAPPEKTCLDTLKAAGKQVIAIGKINDIFSGQGITYPIHTTSNQDGMDQLLHVLQQEFEGMTFTNLVDFDALFGHRRDVAGYARALEEFDARLPEIFAAMKTSDLLMITADHGNDPTYRGTDHTREYVPLLIYSKSIPNGATLPLGHFSDISATLAENFQLPVPKNGKSFLKFLK